MFYTFHLHAMVLGPQHAIIHWKRNGSKLRSCINLLLRFRAQIKIKDFICIAQHYLIADCSKYTFSWCNIWICVFYPIFILSVLKSRIKTPTSVASQKIWEQSLCSLERWFSGNVLTDQK